MKQKKTMGKKGSLFDLAYLVIFVFVFAIISIISYTIWLDAEPKLNQNLDSDTAANITADTGTAITNLDYAIMTIIIGLLLATMIGAYFINTHPVFFIASFLLLLLMLIFMPILSNVFSDVTSHSSISVAAESFSISSSFFNDLPKYFVIMAGLVLIAMFAKHRTGGGEL